MLAQFQGTRYLTITVANFKERLQLEGKYERFANLKARVIEPAIKELNQKTSIEVKWVPIKKGRTVERLEFRFEEKAQMALL
ncbi:MAG: replication initiation protein [Thiotrichaceae bacterium]